VALTDLKCNSANKVRKHTKDRSAAEIVQSKLPAKNRESISEAQPTVIPRNGLTAHARTKDMNRRPSFPSTTSIDPKEKENRLCCRASAM
jgi:hypothetical protein